MLFFFVFFEIELLSIVAETRREKHVEWAIQNPSHVQSENARANRKKKKKKTEEIKKRKTKKKEKKKENKTKQNKTKQIKTKVGLIQNYFSR